MKFHLKISLSSLLTLCILNIVPALYIEFEPAKKELNTENYSLFSNAIFESNKKDTSDALKRFPKEVASAIKTYRKELREYGKIADALKQLATTSGATLIDSEWVIGPKHVLEQLGGSEGGVALETANGTMIGVVIGKIDYPDETVDLALGRLWTLSELTPIKRYRLECNNSTTLYAYSDELHNQEGISIGKTPKGQMPLFAYCKLSPSSKGQYREMSLTGPKEFHFAPGDGDSGGGLFIKVGNTENPLRDYKLVGVFDPAPSYSEATGQITYSLSTIWLPSSNTNAWVDSMIISDALKSH